MRTDYCTNCTLSSGLYKMDNKKPAEAGLAGLAGLEVGFCLGLQSLELCLVVFD